MRILHFLWSFENGGAEHLVVDLANEQSREHEVVVVSANGLVNPLVRNRLAPAVQFVCLGRPEGSRNPYWVARLLLALHRLRPDVIHAHSDKLASLGTFIAAPLILTVHDTHIALVAATKRFAMVCCISDAVLRDVRSRHPWLRVCKVNNGIVIRAIATGPRPPFHRVRGIQVSRLVHEKKGQDLLIKAVALVNADASPLKLSIDFVGDGASMDYLVACAAEAGVSNYCHFVGSKSRSEVYGSLCSYDILVQPSRFEGFGLTVAEGMAARVAVVVSDVEGPMEIIQDGEFGRFFKSGDVQSLASALRAAMSAVNTPQEEVLLDAARSHAASCYDLQQTASHYCQVYAEALHG